MMLSRIGVLVVCIVLAQFLFLLQPTTRAAQVQQSQQAVPSSLYTQQAVTQVQVTQQAADIAKLQAETDTLRTSVSGLKEDLGTLRGIGLGATAVIGLLQGLQMFLQVRAVKKG